MNAQKQSGEQTLGITELSEDVETEGFDLQAGSTWIYPTNYPCRDYQYAIIQEALLKNTMVSLPTGLGKTFIAAVVMYNFYRWYPTGKVIFMAPTKPLVRQQVEACYNVMAIPKEVTAELTGTKLQKLREDIWKEKRVFFITPQVLQNDLNILQNFGGRIKCLVIDEAHKAKGNHAYCEVIRKLKMQNKYFRVLALSATPGNSVKDVAEVIDNLLIAHLEMRTDDSPDVLPYVFERSLETVVVPLGDVITKVRDDYLQVLEKYTKVLMQNKILSGNCSMLTKGKIFMTMKLYQEQNKQNRERNYSENMRYLNICHTLYYAYELLLRHGLRSFLLFFQDRLDKTMLHDNITLRNIIRDIEEYMGPLLNIESLPDGGTTGIPDTVKFGHPKFYKLRDVACEHFKQQNSNETRIIIFCEYRETVMEAYGILLLSQPLVKPKIFMGKTSITQKQQINVIKSFRDGSCNTLISTCIGEEGLDVGNVDLIICFDINNKSPIRMIQRMGRTGRKRKGRVVVFVTEGREQQTLKECLIQKQNLSNHILHYKPHINADNNPRMVPTQIEPKCNKIFITVQKESRQKGSKSKSIKDVFKLISERKNHTDNTSEAKLIDIVDLTDQIPDSETFWNSSKASLVFKSSANRFSDKLNKQRILQPVGFIKHSSKTQMMVSLLEKCDSSKFNLPITQSSILISQRPANTLESLSLHKQKDIRNMLLPPSQISAGFPTVNSEPFIIDSGTNSNDSNCKLCDNFFDCTQYYSTFNLSFKISEWIEPDVGMYDKINCDTLRLYEKAMDDCDTEKKSDIVVKEENESDVLIGGTIGLVHSPFKLPKTINNVLRLSNLLDSTLPDIPITQLELAGNSKENMKNELEDVKLGPEKTSEDDLNDALDFFNISALENIFDDTHNRAQLMNSSESSNSTILYTPEKVCRELDSPIMSMSNKSHIADVLTLNKVPNERTELKLDVHTNREDTSLDLCDIVDTSIISPVLSNRSIVCTKSKSVCEDAKSTKNTKQDLQEFLDNSIIDMFYNETFEELPKEPEQSVLEELGREKAVTLNETEKEKNEIINSSNNINKSMDWENNIWSFCMDSNISVRYDEKNSIATPKEIAHVSKDNGEKEIIDVVCDRNYESSPSKSPSLFKSQRTSNRSQLSCNEYEKITTASCSKYNQPISPVLNKSQIKIDSNLKMRKTSKKLSFSDDDDDDFELEPKLPWIFPKEKSRQNSTNSLKNVEKNHYKKQKIEDAPYIELEADVSGHQSDTDEIDEDGSFEKSFVDDETQDIANTTMMHVKYLESVKTRNANHGKFKIPQLPVNNVNVYSQIDNDNGEDNTYMNDTFCVDTEDIDVLNTTGDLSELEVAELLLEQERKKKKSKLQLKTVKRRRIIDSSSDTD